MQGSFGGKERRHLRPHRLSAPGRDGGKDGAAGVVGLKSGKRLRGKGFQLIPPGDRLVVMTPGGAGLGGPKSRDRAAVARDLAEGLVSPEGAKIYGA